MIGRITVCLLILVGILISNAASAAVYHDSVLTNGKFDDDLLGWTGSNVSSANLGDQYALDGQFVTLGQMDQTQSISQTLTIDDTVGQATLSFYYRLYTDDTANDYLEAEFTRADTGKVLISERIPASRGDEYEWTKVTVDASRIAGKTVILTLKVVNNASAFTFVDIDTIRLNIYSNGELAGTVQAADTSAVRNATVTIRQHNGTKVWTGETNRNGKFTASLAGKSKKYQVTVKKNGQVIRQAVRVQWAERTHKTFTLSL